MKERDTVIRVFSGSEVVVRMLKAQLEALGIITMLRNEFQSGVVAGFVAGIPSQLDLFIREEDLAAALPVLTEFGIGNTE